MAIPMSAILSAGASLTPSPVTATISPFLQRFDDVHLLFGGDTREDQLGRIECQLQLRRRHRA